MRDAVKECISDAAVSIIVERSAPDPQVLLQRRTKPEAGLLCGLLELPQGRLRQGESLLACARRELREETGLLDFWPRSPIATRETHGHSLESIGTLAVRQRGQTDALAICIVGTARGVPRASEESSRPAWYSRQEVRLKIAAGLVFPANVLMLEEYLIEFDDWHLDASASHDVAKSVRRR